MSHGCGEVKRMRSMPSIAATMRQQAAEIDRRRARYALTVCPSRTTSLTPVAASARHSWITRVGRHAALASAHVGHDAEGAEAVASAHHGDVGARTARVIGAKTGVGFAAVQAHVDNRVEARLTQELGQAPVAVGPRHQVEIGGLFDQPRAIVLRHAAQQSQARARAADA